MLDPDPGIASTAVTHFKKVIAAAAALGLNTVNGFVGRDWTKSIDENWPTFLSTWRPIVKYAEDHGVRIGIENCPMSFTRDEWPGGKNLFTTPVIWRRAFNDIDSPNFGLNYDPSHFILQDMDPISLWQSSSPGFFTSMPKMWPLIAPPSIRWGALTFP
nr:sugar phosphate isomerase/epimerase family protein [Verrucomicrobium spinosum]